MNPTNENVTKSEARPAVKEAGSASDGIELPPNWLVKVRGLISIYLAVYPLLLVGIHFAAWFTARWVLGHRPRPSIDDPKSIGPIVAIYHDAALVVLVVGIPLFVVLAATLLVSCVSAPQSERRKMIRLLSGCLAGLILSILFLRWDPLGMVNWLTD